jgi:outer membrane biosynthesis protein TonB
MALAAPSSSPTMYRQRETMQYDAMKAKTEPNGMGGGRIAEEKKTTAMTIGEITAIGGLNREIIRTVVEKNKETLETCSQRNISGGKVVLVLTINPNGTVKNIQVTSSTLKNNTITQCFVDTLKKLLFPVATDGHATTATITFIMS